MKRYLPFALILLVGAGALGSGVALFHHQKNAIALAEVAAEKEATDGKPGARPPHVRGDADAPLALEEFGDFQCPPCGNLAPILGRIEKDYGKKLRVIFRQYPLQMHAHAEEAARVAEAAGLQDRFWEMYDQLYQNQNTWSRAENVTELFQEYAGKLGLDRERFEKDVASEKVKDRIEADKARADSLGVESTPTLYLNGHRVPQIYMNEIALHKVLDDMLSGKPPVPPPTPAPSPSAAPVTSLPLK